MKRLLVFISLLLISSILSSCEKSYQQFNTNELERTLQNLYFESDNEAGFINPETKKIDIMLTYRAYLINEYFGSKFKVNEGKLKNLLLIKLLDMTDIKKINRGLSKEKETIDLSYKLQINIDKELKTKIINTLENYLIEESRKKASTDKAAINNNHQYKVQIHYNFLYIADKLDIGISETATNLISENLNSVEENLSDIESNSVKALYYINMVKYNLNLPIQKNDIFEKLEYLRMPDGGYTFLPIEDQKTIKLYKDEVKSDAFSTRLVNELLLYLKNSTPSEEAVNYLKEAILNSSEYNDAYLYINNLYEVVYLSKIIGYNKYNEIAVGR